MLGRGHKVDQSTQSDTWGCWAVTQRKTRGGPARQRDQRPLDFYFWNQPFRYTLLTYVCFIDILFLRMFVFWYTLLTYVCFIGIAHVRIGPASRHSPRANQVSANHLKRGGRKPRCGFVHTCAMNVDSWLTKSTHNASGWTLLLLLLVIRTLLIRKLIYCMMEL